MSTLERAGDLHATRQAFVTATVVRAQRPTSAKAGDVALVLADGRIEGFVGGICAEESVRLHALRALETGEPVLLRLVPEAGEDAAAADGTVTSHNPCLSGGALEIFLAPTLPAPRLVITGETPIAAALRVLAPGAGFVTGEGLEADDLALVVASHGREEESVLGAALEAGVPYVALVASPRRGAAVRAALDVPEALRARLRSPAGLDIGASTPAEIALSILAEIIQERRAGRSPAELPIAAAADSCCHHEG